VCDPPYVIKRLNRDTLRQKGVSIRSSCSWIDTFKTPNGGLDVPFIDKLGRFTGSTLYKWSCDPRSLIATVVSTISKRLVDYCRRHNKYSVIKKHLRSLLGASAYYAFTKDLRFWDRILFFCRNLQERGNLVHRLRLLFSSRWDDNKRFVYSQVIFQTDWLLFRAARPRDKSHFFKERARSRWSNPEASPSKVIVTNIVRDIAYAMSRI